ncbi:MAG: PD-(D/E)XK nuclease family protein [Thermovirgaceae bacterium]
MAITVTGYHRARDIEGELARLGSGRDPSPVFLVPSTGDRELLRDIILEKVSFGPSEPPILRWEDLYREAAREMDVPRGARRRQIDPPDHWLIVRHVLERLKARVEEAAIPAGARHGGFIWTLGEDLRELLREEVRPGILAQSMGCDQRCQGSDCPKLPDPGALLCRLYRDYLEYLDAHSLADSAQTATVIARTLEEDPPRAAAWVGGRDFVFVGFMSFTRSQLSLIGVLSRLGARVRVFMPESGLQYHDARAQLLGDDPAALPIKAFDPIPFLTVVAGDPRLELETLARNLALWRAGKGELQARLGIPFPGWGEIGLSLDAPRLGLAVEVLSRYRIPHTLRGGPSVSETALWKTASSVIEAAALGFPPEETSHILAQPWVTPDGFDLRDTLSLGPRGEKGWRDHLRNRGDREALSFFDRMEAFVSVVEKGARPSALLRSLGDLAGDAAGVGLSRFIIDHPSLDESARHLNAALEELEHKLEQTAEMENAIGPAGTVILRGSDAAAFLSAWSEHSTVRQPPGTRDSLTLYAGGVPVLAHHKVFILTGLTADAWPGRLWESPLLDDGRKEAIHGNPETGLSPSHLPLLKEKRSQREAMLLRMIASADEVCVGSRPNQDDPGRPLQPSVFITSALAGPRPWATEVGGDPPLWRSMKDVIPGEGEPAIAGIEARASDPPFRPSRLLEIPPPTPWPEGAAKRVPVSGIDTWGDCPFKYYAEKVLRIERPHPWGFDAARAGNVAHALWEKSWAERMATGENLPALALKHWEAALSEQYPELAQFPVRLELFREHTFRMAALQQELDDAGLAAARVSQQREQLLEMEIGGVLFRGKFDRVDLLDDGSALVFDYKTGRSDNLAASLQLPAYAVILQRTREVPVSGYAYLSQRDRSFTGRLEGRSRKVLPGWGGRSGGKLEVVIEKARERLQAMAESVAASDFPPNYDNDKVCRYCDFQDLCRRKESPRVDRGEEDGNGS